MGVVSCQPERSDPEGRRQEHNGDHILKQFDKEPKLEGQWPENRHSEDGVGVLKHWLLCPRKKQSRCQGRRWTPDLKH